jgi:hypothetical protein
MVRFVEISTKLVIWIGGYENYFLIWWLCGFKISLGRLKILVDRFSKTFKEHYHVTKHGKWYFFPIQPNKYSS